MSSLFDYITWRGDLDFSRDDPNEVDAMIFCFMIYADLIPYQGMNIHDATAFYFMNNNINSTKLGLIIPSENVLKMLLQIARSKRFSPVVIENCINDVNFEEYYQFCAYTLSLDEDKVAVVFGGTDDSIVGWYEDFQMSYLKNIPSQVKAQKYLEEAIATHPGKKIYVMGHSKGGNLAVYAAIKCKPEYKGTIERVYSLDGPGFSDSFSLIGDYEELEDKIDNLVPQSSMVGVLFSGGKTFKITKSSYRGLYQHDGFSWDVKGNSFVKLSKFSQRGEKNDKQINAKLSSMTKEQKQEFTDEFFGIILRTGAKTLTELASARLKGTVACLKEFSKLDKEKRELMVMIFMKLIDSRNPQSTTGLLQPQQE